MGRIALAALAPRALLQVLLQARLKRRTKNVRYFHADNFVTVG
jgi:hypothetical protein